MDRLLKTFACVALALALLAPLAAAQEEGMPPMGPTQELKDLAAKLAGEWTAEMQFRQMPEEPWVTAVASNKINLEMDGCILRTAFETTMMGMPMKGEETLTYNREKGHFESVWIDSFSARPMYTTGNFEDGKMVMSGKDEMMGQPFLIRLTTIMTSETQMDWTMEMSMDDGKTWFESMKATYTKKS